MIKSHQTDTRGSDGRKPFLGNNRTLELFKELEGIWIMRGAVVAKADYLSQGVIFLVSEQWRLKAEVGIGLNQGRMYIKNTNLFRLVNHSDVRRILTGSYQHLYTVFYTA